VSFKPEVITVSDPGHWVGNALRFATQPEAEASARDLAARWTAVVDWRVVGSTDAVNYRWVDGHLDPLVPPHPTKDASK
jgi:hypothetical protein